jgi:RimJ/RimL family protein N-acetyltransferase
VLVYTDEANTRSAAVPRRLGYTLVGVEDAPRSAPDETGRQQVWARTRPISASEPPRA